ncbi:GspH/FimT family pseudopilin [Agarivorans sp. TSD2052]|uniref:GspH/FimT family pseudopilin n=1 Tax=Agarivorans sp. TSD2052 TaxID=2937286 RepID=UPI00200D0263|nr:GspH/FimT family pseudopilin [Agarivorans sp. TSD2052]UPW17754.1 GspH/FimT family pseudopilin [Agarivorans sp. TSD2052]
MKQAGFTLLELLITVAIAVILLGIGLPNLSNLFQFMAADASTNRIMREVRFARSQAINLNQRVVICALQSNASDCGGGVNSGLTVFGDDNNNGKLDTSEKVLLAAEPFSKAGKVDFSGNINSLTFGSDGLISGNSGSIYFCSNDNSYIDGVKISLAGNIRFVTDSEKASCPI